MARIRESDWAGCAERAQAQRARWQATYQAAFARHWRVGANLEEVRELARRAADGRGRRWWQRE